MTDAHVRRAPGVLQRSLEGEYVLYHPGTDEAMVLDRIGSLVWDALESGPTRAELVDSLADQFEQSVERITSDLEPLLNGLLEARMIRVGGTDQRPGEG